MPEIAEKHHHNFGLDLVRAMAIIFVLITHCGINTYTIYQFGFFGVELFFSLSGFLIGQIVICSVLKDPSFRSLFNFYRRRWLRTLPLYYLVLMLLIVTGCLATSDFKFPWFHFIFLQNFFHAFDTFFPVSWSLSIEEWSYLLIPLLFLMVPVKNYSGHAIFIILFSFAFVILCARFLITVEINPSYEVSIRKSLPLRLDAIIYGFAMANIKIHYKKFFLSLGSVWILLSVIIIFFILNSVIKNILIYNFTGEKTIPSSIGFPLLAILFSSAFPFFSLNTFIQKLGSVKLFRIFFEEMSRYSYCIYLIHYGIFKCIITRDQLSFEWLMQYVLAIAIVVSIAALSFQFFEKPILAWRDKNIRI
jgi:peptidoglycan/LPS O-acetylase OafA/YrhL